MRLHLLPLAVLFGPVKALIQPSMKQGTYFTPFLGTWRFVMYINVCVSDLTGTVRDTDCLQGTFYDLLQDIYL
jgi:hypothetical protein